MLVDLDAARGLRSISLRYSNAAGADPEGAIGGVHDPETHLIPLVLAAARDGKRASVFGDSDTTDGTCVRGDYEIAEAPVLALEYFLRGVAHWQMPAVICQGSVRCG
jgi:UDP-glucose 4-epimerase